MPEARRHDPATIAVRVGALEAGQLVQVLEDAPGWPLRWVVGRLVAAESGALTLDTLPWPIRLPDGTPGEIGLYRALIVLGYQLSDAERARVFPEPADEVLCGECRHPAADHDIDDGVCFAGPHGTPACSCAGLVLAEADS